ncbi:MAG: hypothetical protein WD271_04570 [Acidimicrobiia bacterium]
MSARRRLRLHTALLVSAVAVAVVALVTVASATSTATAAPKSVAKEFPPSSRKELVKIFAPKIAPLGLHITRAALVDSKNRRSTTGTHLAVYVEPDGEYSPAEYLNGIATVSRVFLPFVFDRWPGLRSFDVCQEPLPERDKRSEPPPETQVFVLRRGVDAVDWEHVDLAELLARGARASRKAGDSGRVELSVFVAKRLQTVPEFTDAFSRAADEVQTKPTSSTRYR